VNFNLFFENEDNIPLCILTYECEEVEIKLCFFLASATERVEW
jgi:hypothetical protein